MKDKENSDTNDRVSEVAFTAWCEEMCLGHPMFSFSSLVLDLELTLLAFIRALRTSDFELYTESLAKLAPWFFAMDHVHYARWVPVHVCNMTTLH